MKQGPLQWSGEGLGTRVLGRKSEPLPHFLPFHKWVSSTYISRAMQSGGDPHVRGADVEAVLMELTL